jgi:hypothetical protein
MRKQFVMMSSLTCLYLLAGSAVPVRADDVYVDLSVLNELRSGGPVVYKPAPLFPEVKSPSRKSSAERKLPAPASSKSATVKKKKTPVAKKTAPKVVIPEKAVPVPGLRVSVPALELKNVSENIEKDAAAPVAAIKKEPLPELPTSVAPDLSSESAQVATQPVAEKAFEAAKEQAGQALPSASNEIRVETPEPAVENLVPVAEKPEPPKVPEMVFVPQKAPEKTESVPAAVRENSVPSVEASAPQSAMPQLLVPTARPTLPVSDRTIGFAPGSEELTPENRQKIDAIIAGFENPGANMIAINSYNYDDGNDVFTKKRLSLRRIVAVRSYLLGKGYKNFMPKVINLTDDASKADVVELEEVK